MSGTTGRARKISVPLYLVHTHKVHTAGPPMGELGASGVGLYVVALLAVELLHSGQKEAWDWHVTSHVEHAASPRLHAHWSSHFAPCPCRAGETAQTAELRTWVLYEDAVLRTVYSAHPVRFPSNQHDAEERVEVDGPPSIIVIPSLLPSNVCLPSAFWTPKDTSQAPDLAFSRYVPPPTRPSANETLHSHHRLPARARALSLTLPRTLGQSPR